MTRSEVMRAGSQEIQWWLRRVGRSARRAPGRALVAVALLWLTAPEGFLWASLAMGMLIGLRVWSLRAPLSFGRVAGRVRGVMWRRRLRSHWRTLCEQCGLGQPVPRPAWSRSPEIGRWRIPRIVTARAAWPHLTLVLRPLLGQTLGDFERAAEAVRLGVGASRLRVDPHGLNGVQLTFTVGDELRVPFAAVVPAHADPLDAVSVGRRDDGKPWRLAIGPHTLVAGCSGAGKGSVFWSFAFALAPAVAEGRVRLHGIDLKGGMEIRMGDPLFTTSSTSPTEAVVALEMLVGWMRERTRAYAGRVRSHNPTTAEPLHVVMIDELAALTAYCPERDLQRRAEAAINLLCSQGRAPGFMVFACLQDPRKEVIPSRGLFTQMVGLRLKDLSETSMVLGEAAVESGAWCHRITRDVPGTGFVLPEDGSHPVRVRAGYASDDAIRNVARHYATPTRIPVVVPAEDESSLPRRQTKAKAP